MTSADGEIKILLDDLINKIERQQSAPDSAPAMPASPAPSAVKPAAELASPALAQPVVGPKIVLAESRSSHFHFPATATARRRRARVHRLDHSQSLGSHHEALLTDVTVSDASQAGRWFVVIDIFLHHYTSGSCAPVDNGTPARPHKPRAHRKSIAQKQVQGIVQREVAAAMQDVRKEVKSGFKRIRAEIVSALHSPVDARSEARQQLSSQRRTCTQAFQGCFRLWGLFLSEIV